MSKLHKIVAPQLTDVGFGDNIKKQFENIILILPPLAEQKKIVDAVHDLFDKLDAIMESL